MEHRAPVVWKDDEGQTRTGQFIGFHPEGVLVDPDNGRPCFVDSVEPMSFLRKHRWLVRPILIGFAVVAVYAMVFAFGDGSGSELCERSVIASKYGCP